LESVKKKFPGKKHVGMNVASSGSKTDPYSSRMKTGVAPIRKRRVWNTAEKTRKKRTPVPKSREMGTGNCAKKVNASNAAGSNRGKSFAHEELTKKKTSARSWEKGVSIHKCAFGFTTRRCGG